MCRIQLICFVVASLWTSSLMACPFCGAISGTISDEMSEAKVVIVARCTAFASPSTQDALAIASFDAITIMKGSEFVESKTNIKVASLDTVQVGEVCLLLAYDCEPLEFGTPLKLSETAQAYLNGMTNVAAKGRDRLSFFLGYVDVQDKLVSDDAYNEFARASFEDVQEIRDLLNREQVIKVIQNPETPLQLRRLYWTFLSICGLPEDREVFRQAWHAAQSDSSFNPGLDAAISCVLVLLREEGLAEISRDLLDNPKAEFSDVYSAIVALRVHMQELHVLDRKKVLEAMHPLLKRMDIADQVIADLARWEDWSVVDQLVQLFRDSEESNSRLRLPIIQYMLACPNRDANDALLELEKLDPQTVRKAKTFFGNAIRTDQAKT